MFPTYTPSKPTYHPENGDFGRFSLRTTQTTPTYNITPYLNHFLRPIFLSNSRAGAPPQSRDPTTLTSTTTVHHEQQALLFALLTPPAPIPYTTIHRMTTHSALYCLLLRINVSPSPLLRSYPISITTPLPRLTPRRSTNSSLLPVYPTYDSQSSTPTQSY